MLGAVSGEGGGEGKGSRSIDGVRLRVAGFTPAVEDVVERPRRGAAEDFGERF